MVNEMYFANVCNGFLKTLPKQKRIIFMQRYWYMNSIKEICADFQMSESKVKMLLMRLREQFRKFLEKEGVSL